MSYFKRGSSMLKDKEKTDLMLKTKNIFEKKKTENKF